MAIADYTTKDNLHKLIHHSHSDYGQEVRPRWADGETAYSYKVFGVMNQYNLANEFPINTLRPTAWKTGLKEIFWIYRDKSDNVDFLEEEYGVKFWRSWADDNGTLNGAYGGEMSRLYDFGDREPRTQIDELLKNLKEKPYSRRHVMNLYHHERLKDYTLAPCAFMTMWDVKGDYLNMTLVQRSSDYVVAGNINVCQYALLQHMVARHCGLKVGLMNHYINNLHLYNRHLGNAKELLTRKPRKAPKLIIDESIDNFYDFKPEHFKLEGYDPHPQMKFEIAI